MSGALLRGEGKRKPESVGYPPTITIYFRLTKACRITGTAHPNPRFLQRKIGDQASTKKAGHDRSGLLANRELSYWISKCSGCSRASDFTRTLRRVSSSISWIHFPPAALSALATSGLRAA